MPSGWRTEHWCRADQIDLELPVLSALALMCCYRSPCSCRDSEFLFCGIANLVVLLHMVLWGAFPLMTFSSCSFIPRFFLLFICVVVICWVSSLMSGGQCVWKVHTGGCNATWAIVIACYKCVAIPGHLRQCWTHQIGCCHTVLWNYPFSHFELYATKIAHINGTVSALEKI